ncbi:MAG: PilZ domain-containing protein [Candidatus Scalindua sp.]
MHEISEKRKYKRIKKQYIARLRIKPDEVQDMIPTDWDMVALNDLGAGGIFFHIRRKLEIGTTLDLKIGLSVSMPPIECRGVVTRVQKHPNFSVFGIATEFTEIDDRIKEMINKNALFVNPDNQFLYNKT